MQMACKEKKNLIVYIIKHRLEKLCQQYQQIKIALSQSLVDTLVLPQRKRKERKKKHPFFQKKGKRLPCMLQCLSLCWNGISRVNLVLELKSKLRWQQQNYTGITASHELSLCSCVPNLPSNHRWYCHEGPQAVDK